MSFGTLLTTNKPLALSLGGDHTIVRLLGPHISADD